jgi:p-aminobenzoyl-glutamate transporter AbgT
MQERNRFLDGVERLGNALPDPALIFVALIDDDAAGHLP